MKQKFRDDSSIYHSNNLEKIIEANTRWEATIKPIYGYDGEGAKYYIVGGIKSVVSKLYSYKHYLKAFKTYSKRKLKTFRKKRNYKKTKRRKH